MTTPDNLMLGAALSPFVALFASLVCAIAWALAGRRRWPLSVRRALFFSLLLAALVFGGSLLTPEGLTRTRPGLLVAAGILALVALVEAIQYLLFDLTLAGWLKRPPVPRILRDFATVALAITAFLVLLRGTLGVNLSSLLATSAMISIVLGLALQDTLGGFFAGLALQMEGPLAAGDWVEIEGSQGRVSQVGWRAVRLVTLDGDEITLPNSLVTRSTLLNFSRPVREHRLSLSVRVSDRQPPREVLAVLTAAPREVPGVLAHPQPQALLWEFGESEMVYQTRYWIDDYSQANYIRSEVATRVWYQLLRAGIEMGYPALVLQRPAPEPGPRDWALRAAAALRAVDLFEPLAIAEREALAGRLRPLLFAAGETVIRQGERGDSLFVVTRGLVEVRVITNGKEAVVGNLGAGNFFGEMSLLTGGPRTATVVALEDAEVFPVRREDFRHVVLANPKVLEDVTRIVSERRGRLDETIRELEKIEAHSTTHLALLGRVRSFFGL